MITEQQRNERNQGIGGSDMPVILGLSSYKTPYQLYLEKTGQFKSEQEQNQFQYWGEQLEGVIRDEFAKRNNTSLLSRSYFTYVLFPGGRLACLCP